ncbi:MAG: GH3 auxin-responsive promoter family protein [Fibrobacterota bacterium]|nr:GH3 auxin-responsive promoter family protein [Fibrobacterota bacterium]
MREMGSIGLRCVQACHRLSLTPARNRFAYALRECEAVQTGRLNALIKANAGTAYGRLHGFPSITSLREWQDRVPIVTYDELQPWVQRAAMGEASVLTAEPIRIFERTGGSTAANKLIPYTASLLREFAAATGPWLHDLHVSVPELRGTTSYWSISPATRQAERTAGGIPVGFDDDTGYFGILERLALRRMMAVPGEVARLRDMEAWARATVRHLAAAEDLGLISVWHPSFFVLLLRRIEADLDECLSGVSPRRAAAVRSRLRNKTLGEALWPRLALVSCWADGAAASAVDALMRYLPHARLQPKGLLATEGVVSFPLHEAGQTGSVAAVAGHFLEFLDLDNPSTRPRLAHELRPGGAYAPLLSTGGGFYRYRLGDAVRCTGFHGQAPLLRFEGRIDQVSDLCGEKLNPRMVAAAIACAERASDSAFAFALLAPAAGNPPHYRFFAETGMGSGRMDEGKWMNACRALEDALCESHGYCYARSLGQLGPVCGVAVRDGAARYLLARTAAGQRSGDVKPSCLDGSRDWSEVFTEVLQSEVRLAEAGT